MKYGVRCTTTLQYYGRISAYLEPYGVYAINPKHMNSIRMYVLRTHMYNGWLWLSAYLRKPEPFHNDWGRINPFIIGKFRQVDRRLVSHLKPARISDRRERRGIREKSMYEVRPSMENLSRPVDALYVDGITKSLRRLFLFRGGSIFPLKLSSTTITSIQILTYRPGYIHIPCPYRVHTYGVFRTHHKYWLSTKGRSEPQT